MGAIPHKAVPNRFPQTGGNQTSEAPGVIYDPTLGDEGVETPPTNDSLKGSLSPPVRGCLGSFNRDWQTNNCSSNVLNIINNGYVLPFISKPNLVRFPLIQSEYKALQKHQALATCIQSRLSKNAIERVEKVKSVRFYSRPFLVPKPCKTHPREMAHTSGFDPMTQVKTCFDCKMFDVANWVACLNVEDGPEGHLHMRHFQFHLKEHWRFPQLLDSLLP